MLVHTLINTDNTDNKGPAPLPCAQMLCVGRAASFLPLLLPLFLLHVRHILRVRHRLRVLFKLL
jgi:hypothetical protein